MKQTIFQYPEFVEYMDEMNRVFNGWQVRITTELKALEPGFHPKVVIYDISEALLTTYAGKALIGRYDVYQHLMNYWFEVMQDDCYLIAADGWQAQIYRIIETNKKGKEVDKGWTCDLIPKVLVISRYFADEQQAIDDHNAELENQQSRKTEMEEEHSGEDGAFAELEKINKGAISARLKELRMDNGELIAEEIEVFEKYLALLNSEAETKKAIKESEAELDARALDFYPTLTQTQIKQLVVDDKWMATIDKDIHSETDRISQGLTQRIKELGERYETPLPQQTQNVVDLEKAVNGHLENMGFAWN